MTTIILLLVAALLHLTHALPLNPTTCTSLAPLLTGFPTFTAVPESELTKRAVASTTTPSSFAPLLTGFPTFPAIPESDLTTSATTTSSLAPLLTDFPTFTAVPESEVTRPKSSTSTVAGHGEVTTTCTTTSDSVNTAVPTSLVPTTTASSHLTIKTNVPDCNFQAIPIGFPEKYKLYALWAFNPYHCQNYCQVELACLSYSFRPGNTWSLTCTLHSVPFTNRDPDTGSTLVVPGHPGLIYYSNRWPSDGSGFCYGWV